MESKLREGYKMTELGALPEEWEVEKLGNLANYLNGRAFKPDDWGTTGLPIIRIDQMNNPNTKHDYYNGQVDEDNLLQNGDLLFSWSATLKVMIWNRGAAALNQHIFKVVPKNKMMKLYFYHLLNYNLDTLAGHSHGSTMKHIKKSDLVKFKVPLPPLPEQHLIATILSTLDETVEHTEALIEKYKNIKAGLMSDLLTRGIDDEGRIRSEETHRFKDSALGRVPEEWRVKKLVHVATLQRGFDLPIQARTDGNVPVYGSNGINGFHSKVGVLGPGIVTGRSGSIGFVYHSEVDFWPLNTTLYVKDFHGNNPKFIWRLLQSLQLERFVAATGVPSLNRNFVHPLLVLVPPLQEQRRIAEILTAADQRIEKEETYRDKLLQLKKGLMQDLLTGKVRVKDGSAQMAEQSEN